MAISVLATLVGTDGDEAVYDFVGDPAEPAVRVTLRWTGDRVEADDDPDADPRRFVHKGVVAVAAERSEQGTWPGRVVRIS